jgi:uncharacterized damage-inducible protein DinB
MTKAKTQDDLTTVLVSRWERVLRKLAELADAIPAEKFESKPAAGMRTPGEVIRHVAFWNQYVADSLRGKNADESANELPFAEYSTKASTLKALKQSSADAAAALQSTSPLDLKTAELVVIFLEHASEHYGQLVVYTRLMNIVPPASRA